VENFPVHFCPNCGRHQSVTTHKPAVVVCFACQFRDPQPARSLFGRAEWDASDRPATMLLCVRLLGCATSPRKNRLLVCHLARAAFADCTDPWFRAGLECAEVWADAGAAPPEARGLRAYFATRDQFGSGSLPALALHVEDEVARWEAHHSDPHGAKGVCELFANPFAARVWNRDWFTSTVRDLAAHIYNAHEFSSMPILADALQDAGCEDEQILTHCRADKPHARGCWVLDAILGKT
jgi:hypothetical protein